MQANANCYTQAQCFTSELRHTSLLMNVRVCSIYSSIPVLLACFVLVVQTSASLFYAVLELLAKSKRQSILAS